MKNKVINLKDFIHPKETALVGRENGIDLAKIINKEFNLAQLEKEIDFITIKIPESIIVVNKSYFLGLFEIRIQTLGKDEFLKKYRFETSEYITNKIKNVYVDAALMNLTPMEILT